MDTGYLEYLFGLSGKVAVVTGGGGVLCGTMAPALARVGAKVAVLDLIPEAAQRVVDQIAAAGGEAIAVKCDVLDKESIEAAAKIVMDEYGAVDILINGAGGNKKEATTTPDFTFFDLPADAIQWVFNLNCLGTILPSQVFGRVMAKKKEGVILNIASVNAFLPLTRIPAYSGAKAAVANFTQWLAVHMAQEYSSRIRVNAVAPGFYLTHQNRFLLTDEQTGDLTPRGRTIIQNTPMNRFGDPEELLGTVLWLLSPASEFVTGALVPVDGGFCAFSGV
ncbi:MAG: SDR family oxidoreductase [Anaerolineae bacterium]|nr:SDR family oxidoreductase [Anaerolineae bacterium]